MSSATETEFHRSGLHSERLAFKNSHDAERCFLRWDACPMRRWSAFFFARNFDKLSSPLSPDTKLAETGNKIETCGIEDLLARKKQLFVPFI